MFDGLGVGEDWIIGCVCGPVFREDVDGLACICGCWAVGCGPFSIGAVGSEERET